MDLLRSRLLRSTPSVYSPTSQPFSTCNLPTIILFVGDPPEFLCFPCFLGVFFFFFFFPFFTIPPYSKQSTAQQRTAQRSRAQHSTALNPHKQQSTYAPIRARQRKQADRVGSSQHVVEHLLCNSSLCSILVLLSKRRNQNLPGLPVKKYTTIHAAA